MRHLLRRGLGEQCLHFRFRDSLVGDSVEFFFERGGEVLGAQPFALHNVNLAGKVDVNALAGDSLRGAVHAYGLNHVNLCAVGNAVEFGFLGGGEVLGGENFCTVLLHVVAQVGRTGERVPAGAVPHNRVARLNRRAVGIGAARSLHDVHVADFLTGGGQVGEGVDRAPVNERAGNVRALDVRRKVEIDSLVVNGLRHAVNAHGFEHVDLRTGFNAVKFALVGVADESDPSLIRIYVKSFEDKDDISDAIKRYNDGTSKEQDVIHYTDMVALLMSSITGIISGISYLLIAFVGISLVVSSIMIGIITYISVLERTREIGILRAIGASKHNVRTVFNAETLLVGLTAGLMGIGVSILLTIPINSIIHSVTSLDTLYAHVPVVGAIVLIIISMVLTLISGLIPSGVAARKDPVEALRTE